MPVTVRAPRDATEIEAAMDLRVRVFVGEQGVDPEEEVDDLDRESVQIVGVDDTGVIATCRLRDLGGGEWKLERMVVDRRVRRNGVGATEMLLYAQCRAESFYAAQGYVAEGDTFLEAQIEHVRMRKELGG